MILKHTDKVTRTNGPRPAGDPDQCFFCKQPIGSQHAAHCVCRMKTVVLTLAVNIVVPVPTNWTDDEVESYFNDSSHCKNDLARAVGRMIDRFDKGECLCSRATVAVLRGATEDDHRHLHFRAGDLLET